MKMYCTGSRRAVSECTLDELGREAPYLAVQWDAFAQRAGWINDATNIVFLAFEPIDRGFDAKPTVVCVAKGTNRMISWSHKDQMWKWCEGGGGAGAVWQ